jgi:hypothetical protein
MLLAELIKIPFFIDRYLSKLAGELAGSHLSLVS